MAFSLHWKPMEIRMLMGRSPADLFRIIFLILISISAFGTEQDSLRILLRNLPEDSSQVNVLNRLGKSYFESKPDTRIAICLTAKSLAEKIGYKPGQALALKNIGIAYYLQGKYIDAIKNWDQAIRIYKAIGDKRGVGNILGNQASVYFNQGDEAKSLELGLKSLQISESVNDTLRIVTSLNNIGTVYIN